MVLTYYQEPNFGDAVNPIIFNRLLPGFFDKDEQSLFLGIGSILGLYHGNISTEKIVVFSSGFAYGDMPVIDNRYDIRCVRGPLTAKYLNLSPSLAITDGAVLLKLFKEFMGPVKKKYGFSFIPHHHSQRMFNQWDDLLTGLDVHYISPTMDTIEVINQIRQSEFILAEAMHAAIIADCFRIPWIPVKMFQHINAIKWKDWALSMEMKYKPESLTSLFNDSWIDHMITNRFFPFDKKEKLAKGFSPIYRKYQDVYKKKLFIKEMKEILNKEPFLSKDSVLESRVNQLLEVLEGISQDYGHKIIARDG